MGDGGHFRTNGKRLEYCHRRQASEAIREAVDVARAVEQDNQAAQAA